VFEFTRMSVVSPTSRFAYIEVVSPTRFESIRLHLSRFTYTFQSKYFVKIDQNLCPQLTKDSYLSLFLVKFRDNTASD